jgi:hypothetical protein
MLFDVEFLFFSSLTFEMSTSYKAFPPNPVRFTLHHGASLTFFLSLSLSCPLPAVEERKHSYCYHRSVTSL